jgi:hypothetical protein
MGGAYGGFAADGVSPLPVFVLLGALIYGVWTVRRT